MVKNIKKFQIFLSSPSDAAPIRKEARSILEEVRQVFAQLNYDFDLLEWSEDVSPQIADDAQEAINQKIIDDADLGLVFFWQRLGTATARAVSGTAEEIERTISRWKRGDNCDVLVYFQTVLDGNSLDVDEYSRLQKFRSELMERGVLCRDFKTISDLRQILANHVSERLKYIDRADDQMISSQPQEVLSKEARRNDDEGDEFGILDLHDENAFADIEEVSEIFAELTLEVRDMASFVMDRTDKLSMVSDVGGVTDQRRIVNEVAAVIEKFSVSLARANGRLPALYSAVSNDCANIFLAMEDFDESKDAASLRESIRNLPESIRSSQDHLAVMTASIRSLPRLTKELNRAKKRVVLNLEKLRSDALEFAANIDNISEG